MARSKNLSARERLVYYVQELERLQQLKDDAAQLLSEAFADAKAQGYDTATLRVVLKLRKMTPDQRRERRALEAIYLAALGMLEDDPLPDEARRRLDPPQPAPPPPQDPPAEEAPKKTSKGKGPKATGDPAPTEPPPAPPPAQPALVLKEPAEARQEGADAAAAGKRIYDNPYPAGDPCRAAWDEGWCGQNKSHGMDTPTAYQRRTEKPPKKDDPPKDDDADTGGDLEKKGAA